jgi:hypothetical protein
MKKIAPGFQQDPGFLFQHGTAQHMMRWLSNSPIGSKTIRRFYERAYLEPISNAVEDMTHEISGVSPPLAGPAVRSAVGGAGERSGKVQRKINSLQKPAFAQEGKLVISVAQQDRVLAGLAAMNAQRALELGSRGARGGDLSRLMSSIQKLGMTARRAAFNASAPKVRRGGVNPASPAAIQAASDKQNAGRISVQVYENLKKTADGIAQFEAQAASAGPFKAYSKADVQEARLLRALLSRAERETSPLVDRALTASQPLRALQAELRPLVGTARVGDDAALLQQIFQGKGPLRRVRALHQVLEPDQAQSLAGTYFGDFLADVSKRAGGYNGPKARELWSASSGKYRAELFDTVIGAGDAAAGKAYREVLTDIFETTDRASRSIGASEGSPTAGRLQSSMIAGEAVHSIETLHDIFADPRIIFNKLEQAGGAAFAFATLNSALDGRLSLQLERLATGLPTNAGARLPLAASEIKENMR